MHGSWTCKGIATQRNMPQPIPTVQFEHMKILAAYGTSGVGAVIMSLAQLTPDSVSGWASLGGGVVLTVFLLVALHLQWKKNESLTALLLDTIDKDQKKLDSERTRMEAKWDSERHENFAHREKDRESRDKLAEAVDKLAAVVDKPGRR